MDARRKTFWDDPSYSCFVDGPLMRGLYTLACDGYRVCMRRQHQVGG